MTYLHLVSPNFFFQQNHILKNHDCNVQKDLLEKKAKEFVINYKNNLTTKSPFEHENDLLVIKFKIFFGYTFLSTFSNFFCVFFETIIDFI